MGPISLQIHAPSRTTISYTVSSVPPPRLLIIRALANLLLLLRVAAAAASFLAAVLQCKIALGSTLFSSVAVVAYLEREFQDVVSANAGQYGPLGSRWWVLPLGGSLLAWSLIKRYYVEESLLVIRGLGVQTASSASTYLQGASVRFIATSQIQDIFIYEAFIGFEVRFYLAIVVEGEETVVVVFPKSLPRREILEQVWRGSREVLEWNRDDNDKHSG